VDDRYGDLLIHVDRVTLEPDADEISAQETAERAAEVAHLL
jgi:hypothetical protein